MVTNWNQAEKSGEQMLLARRVGHGIYDVNDTNEFQYEK